MQQGGDAQQGRAAPGRGEQAVDLLLAVMDNRRGVARRRLVAPTLVVRRSTGA